MKKLIAALALVSAAYVASAQAGDVGVSISIGQPGFYGQLDIGNVGRPQVVYGQPVLVERRNWYPAPAYLRVPPYQYSNWRRYCGMYNACGRPVYFVRDDWYRNVYSPRYYQSHGQQRGQSHGYAQRNGQSYGQPYGQPYANQRNDRHDDRNNGHDYDRNNGRNYDQRYDNRYDDRYENGRPDSGYDRNRDHH